MIYPMWNIYAIYKYVMPLYLKKNFFQPVAVLVLLYRCSSQMGTTQESYVLF